MDKQKLIESATQLQQPSSESAQAFGAIREAFASKQNQSMTECKDIIALIGENNTDMMQNNHRNHLDI